MKTTGRRLQRAFDNDRSIINFNNGGVCPTPTHVLEQMIRDLRFTNESPAKHMWQILEPRVESVRRELAREFGCDTEEIAITRNASESMETLILGIDLKAGRRGDRHRSELRAHDHDLGAAARREGIVIKKISFPIPLRVASVFVDRIRAGDHAQDQGHRVPAHHQSLGADLAGP